MLVTLPEQKQQQQQQQQSVGGQGGGVQNSLGLGGGGVPGPSAGFGGAFDHYGIPPPPQGPPPQVITLTAHTQFTKLAMTKLSASKRKDALSE